MSLEEVRPLQLSPDKAECRYDAAHHLMAVGLLSYRAVLEVDLDTWGSSVHVSESEDLSTAWWCVWGPVTLSRVAFLVSIFGIRLYK